MTESITIPDVIPTTTIIETTTTTHEALGSPAETIAKLTAFDWIVEEQSETATILAHPLIPGTKRYILNK